jgi:hypothetical protein
MAFKTGRKFGKYWEDVKQLDKYIHDHDFNSTSKTEKSFENGFANSLKALQDRFNTELVTQVHRSARVGSVHCFGKNHRPDMTYVDIDKQDDIIAIELKKISYAGLKSAIGQGLIYRMKYRFVLIVLIMSDKCKDTYLEIENGQDQNLEDMLKYLAEENNIFTYIVPAFPVKPGIRKVISFYDVNL